jgi:hypothetical protein
MEVYGQNDASFLQGGKLLDQICLGISRPREMPVIDAGEPQVQLEEVTASEGASGTALT